VKGSLIFISVLFCLVAFEGQGGSHGWTVAPALNTAREFHQGQPDPDLKSIRIMTWNIDHGSRLDGIAAAMRGHPADLCLLQEVDWNTERTARQDVAVDLARRLALNGAYAIEFEELSQEHGEPAFIGQATLTRLPIVHSRVLRFDRQSTFWKPRSWIPSDMPLMQRRLGNRVALVTEIQFAGQLLVVYNAHLESRSAGFIQREQLDEIIEDLRRYPGTTAVILGGDLNTKYLPSFFLRRLESQGFHSALGEHIERTHKIAMSLDWIFAKGPVSLHAGVVRRDITDSDHYPVYAVMTRTN
jgi:endonuclease/exonuclease/phosphatase family metal-dependent hydrolase